LLLAAELPEVGAATVRPGSPGCWSRSPPQAPWCCSWPAPGDAWGHILGVFTVVAAFVVGVLIFVQTVGLGRRRRTREQSLYDWISVAGLHVDFGLRIDPLTLRSYCSSRVSAA
jgi:hypothetical protein